MKLLNNKELKPKDFDDTVYSQYIHKIINEKIKKLSDTFDIVPDFVNPQQTAIKLAVNQAVIMELQEVLDEL